MLVLTQTGQEALSFVLVNSAQECFIHSCQITGLSLAALECTAIYIFAGLRFLVADWQFVSVSIDQKFVQWQISLSRQDSSGSTNDILPEHLQAEQLVLKPLSTFISSIADASSIELIPTNNWYRSHIFVTFLIPIFCFFSGNLLLICGEGFQLVQI